MPIAYRAILVAPSARGFSAAGFIGRLPISMLGVGILTMMSQSTGRIGMAGAVSATFALSGAVLGPQISRLVDRHGQFSVLRPAAGIAGLGVIGLSLCAMGELPSWTFFAAAVLAGFAPDVGAAVRSRWAEMYHGAPELHTAYSFEAVLDEVCFIIGPLLSVGLCTGWFPEAGLMASAFLLVAGTYAFTAQRRTEPSVRPGACRVKGTAMRSPGLRMVTVTFVAVGAILGSMDVAVVAFTSAQGSDHLIGPMLAAYPLGSCCAGAFIGMIRTSAPAPRGFPLRVFLLGMGTLPFLLVNSLTFLAVALFVAGLSLAPTMIAAMALVERLVPQEKRTEGMSWVGTGLTLGLAVGFSWGGIAVARFGPDHGFVAPVVAGASVIALAFLGCGRIRGH